MSEPTGLLGSDEVANAVYADLLMNGGGFTRLQIVERFPQFFSTWVYAAINRLMRDGLIQPLMDGAPEFYPTRMKKDLDYEL